MPTIFITLIYFMAHLRYTAAAFFSNFFTVILLGLVSLIWQSHHPKPACSASLIPVRQLFPPQTCRSGVMPCYHGSFQVFS